MKVDKLFVAMKAFIIYKDKVLLLQESTDYKDGTNAGKWGVVGGRINPGENFKEALLREIKEETGLTVKVGRPFYVGEWRPKVRGEQWQIVATFFTCQANKDNVKLSEEHSQFIWVDPKYYKKIKNLNNFGQEAFEAYLGLEK